MRAIGRFLRDLAAVYLFGVLGFFLLLLMVAGAILVWLIGGLTFLFLLVALAESAWWLHTHSHHAAVTALGFYGYAAGSFALVGVLFWLKDELVGWPERQRQRAVMKRLRRLRSVEDASLMLTRCGFHE